MPEPETKPDRRDILRRAQEAAAIQKFDEAATLTESLLENDPCDVAALDMLGFVRFFQGRYEDSKQACEHALALRPDHAYAHKGLGLNLARLGQLERGIFHLHRAIELRPTWADPVHDLAVVLCEQGRFEQALAALDERMRLFPQLKERLEPLREQIVRSRFKGATKA